MITGYFAECSVAIENGTQHFGMPFLNSGRKTITLTLTLDKVGESELAELKQMIGNEIELHSKNSNKQTKRIKPKCSKSKSLKFRG